MSEALNGIIPPPDVLVRDANGLRRWAPVMDSIVVQETGQGGRRLDVFVRSTQAASFDLNADEARHLAELLTRTNAASS